jgi:hypothetical protein
LPNTIEEILKLLRKKRVVLATCPILPLEYKIKNNNTCVLTSTRRIEKWSKIKNTKSLVSYFAYLFTGKGIGKYEPIR